MLGIRHHYNLLKTTVNRATIRYGARVANGPNDDRWSSRTFITLGNPNHDDNFEGAYQWHITDVIQHVKSKTLNFKAYFVYRKGKGA